MVEGGWWQGVGGWIKEEDWKFGILAVLKNRDERWLWEDG